jgi:hypothetical protein
VPPAHEETGRLPALFCSCLFQAGPCAIEFIQSISRKSLSYFGRGQDSVGLQAGRPGFDFQQRQEISLISTASRPALGPTQPLIEWVLGALSPGREADHSPPALAGVKNTWIYTSIPPYIFMAWYLVKHSDNFIFFNM